ncbi:response regulator [Variovorax sp. J22R133]|uniref:response regulator n=1 Tax=Variovorax brevis TaxID=3053503 RepID=UPI002575545F|nr:response regulator [Variovorax sp. J22R133]MDM0111026.1 response regulator [Variovorax sp. J22R133]
MTTDSPRPLRVLVVEDERDTLATTLEALHLLGHSAIGVESAEMARIRYLDGAFDVLLTDVGLPAVSGRELADLLRERSPGLEVIFATGTPQPSGEMSPWLVKPYTLDALDAALKDVSRRL